MDEDSAANCLLQSIRKLLGTNQLERSAHFGIGAAPGKFGRQGPQIDLILVAELLPPKVVLLVVMGAAEADPKRIMRLLTGAGIGGGSQVGKLHLCGVAMRNAATMRPDPAAVARPDLTQRRLDHESWALQAARQEHPVLLSKFSA
jgi:hypothetical protein